MKKTLMLTLFTTIWLVVAVESIVVAFMCREENSSVFWVLLAMGFVFIFRGIFILVTHFENKSRSS